MIDETARLDTILVSCAAGHLPHNIALMRLLIEASSEAAVQEAVRRQRAQQTDEGARRLGAVAALLEGHPGAWTTIRTVMAQAEHDRPAEAGDAVAHWSAVFDRLALSAPEAGVALYALGSPDLLAAATAEILARMRDWGLLGRERTLLDLGCGIGRLALALAPDLACVTGIDVSAEMVAEARRRGATCANVRFLQGSGRDLGGIADASIDVVLAADVFPYLVASGGGLARRHIEEAARVLRPGGALLILNYSYGSEPERDRRELGDSLAAAGFEIERDGTRDFALWDGISYLARLPPCRI